MLILRFFRFLPKINISITNKQKIIPIIYMDWRKPFFFNLHFNQYLPIFYQYFYQYYQKILQYFKKITSKSNKINILIFYWYLLIFSIFQTKLISTCINSCPVNLSKFRAKKDISQFSHKMLRLKDVLYSLTVSSNVQRPHIINSTFWRPTLHAHHYNIELRLYGLLEARKLPYKFHVFSSFSKPDFEKCKS